jgi:hypothetical protein
MRKLPRIPLVPFILIVLVLTVHCQSFGATLVQSVDGGNFTTTTPSVGTATSAAGFSSTTGSGHLLVCIAWGVIGAGSSNGPTFSTPVTSGFTWVSAGLFSLEAAGTGVWYIANAAAMTPGTTTTVTMATTQTGGLSFKGEFSLYEFSGMATSSPVDQSGGVGQSSTAPNTRNTLTTAATETWMFAYAGQVGSNLTQASGWSLGVNATTALIGQTEYFLNVPAGTYTAASTAFSATNPRWAGVWVIFLQGASVVAVPRQRGWVF